jgi:hypothetical protein
MPRKKPTWIITASGERPIHAIAKDLEAAGLESARVQQAIGVITGSASETVAAKLRKVAGVVDVERDPAADAGPPAARETR